MNATLYTKNPNGGLQAVTVPQSLSDEVAAVRLNAATVTTDRTRLVSSIRRAMFHMDSDPAKARKVLSDALESVGAHAPQVSATRIR